MIIRYSWQAIHKNDLCLNPNWDAPETPIILSIKKRYIIR